jgi:hypothetical protein
MVIACRQNGSLQKIEGIEDYRGIEAASHYWVDAPYAVAVTRLK